ncbi:cysteine proteinase inhibitor B-like [Rutidosis leptorrhynchoides]|uniref:cysteine proteinase inhibitor B-like n=1 Tax=Rutidosis leptorrhynchoides TaxID=125765 RepID=UPI003A9A14A2
MAKSNLSVVIFTIVVLISSFVSDAIVGGRTKVDDVDTDKEIQAIGKYSVQEYNRLRRSGSQEINDDVGELKFLKVVEAEKQVVAGMKYYLKIEGVSNDGDVKVFEAVVVVKPWLRSKQLVKFAPSSPVITISLPV